MWITLTSYAVFTVFGSHLAQDADELGESVPGLERPDPILGLPLDLLPP